MYVCMYVYIVLCILVGGGTSKKGHKKGHIDHFLVCVNLLDTSARQLICTAQCVLIILYTIVHLWSISTIPYIHTLIHPPIYIHTYIRRAIETGAHIFPTYVFGANDFFENFMTNENFHDFATWCRRRRFCVGLFWGRFGLPVSMCTINHYLYVCMYVCSLIQYCSYVCMYVAMYVSKWKKS